jgi:hypothetical protein
MYGSPSFDLPQGHPNSSSVPLLTAMPGSSSTSFHPAVTFLLDSATGWHPARVSEEHRGGLSQDLYDLPWLLPEPQDSAN